MAELEVDQSNLPRVQEVRQCFAVLEDGALAYNLQEQEIEQYYSSNVQRSQLVQNDLRVAKRLQDEEQQRLFVLHRQSAQQLEEQDSEYARRIQEDIQRRAEETRRREEDDEEIAKQIQEEEEEELRVRELYESHVTDRDNVSAPLNPPQPARILSEEEEEEWSDQANLPSPTTSDYEKDHYESRRKVYEDRRDTDRRRTHRVPPPREQPTRNHVCEERRGSGNLSSGSGPLTGGWGDVVRLIKHDMSEQGYLSCSSEDELFEPVYRLERVLKRCQQSPGQGGERGKGLRRHHSVREGYGGTSQGGQVGRAKSFVVSGGGDPSRSSRFESTRLGSCSSSCRDTRPGDAQRRVHFQEDSRRCIAYGVSRRRYEGNRAGSEEECTPTTASSYPAWAELGHYQAYCGDSGDVYQLQPQVRRVYRDVDRRVTAHVANSSQSHEEAQRANRARHFAKPPRHVYGVMEEEDEGSGGLQERGRWTGDGYRARGEIPRRSHSLRQEGRWEQCCSRYDHSRRSTWSEPWRCPREERSSTDDEEVEVESSRRRRRRRRRRREEGNRARVPPQRSHSLLSSGHSPRAGPGLQRARVPLDLGELEQVLLDEELARRLQAEEEESIRRDSSVSPSQNHFSEGDFTVAQVAQDEELAHYMQKQEMHAHRQSRELDQRGLREGGGADLCDEGGDFERQRERVDSDVPLSPSEPQPPSPTAMATQQQQFRNIAEDLDPTFQRKENMQSGQNIPGSCPIQASPAFVAPTKRHNDKPGRVKSREKRENTKPKESCKQQ